MFTFIYAPIDNDELPRDGYCFDIAEPDGTPWDDHVYADECESAPADWYHHGVPLEDAEAIVAKLNEAFSSDFIEQVTTSQYRMILDAAIRTHVAEVA